MTYRESDDYLDDHQGNEYHGETSYDDWDAPDPSTYETDPGEEAYNNEMARLGDKARREKELAEYREQEAYLRGKDSATGKFVLLVVGGTILWGILKLLV